MIVSQAKLAQILGITRGRVSQLKADGRLVLVGDEGVDLAASIERLRETGDPGKASTLRLDRAAAWLRSSRSDDDGVDDEPPAAAPPAYREARARREKALADIAELEYLLATGEVVALDDAEYILADIATSTRTALEISPDRLAPVLIHQSRAEIETALRELIREAVENERESLRRHMARLIERKPD